MTALLLALLCTVPCPQPHRNRGTVHAFIRQHPCPSGVDKGSRTRCRGYVVDHICPLACCGLDAVQNMQWQSAVEGKKKDRIELLQCARFCQRPPLQ